MSSNPIFVIMKRVSGGMLSSVVNWLKVSCCVFCCPLLSASDAQPSFADTLDKNPIVRPATVGERFRVEVIDLLFDGIPTSRMDMVHPAMVVSNSVSPEWNLSPVGSGRYSVSFLSRSFMDASMSISVFEKGNFIDKVDPETMSSVASGLNQKYGKSMSFASWQDASFKDAEAPRLFRSHQPFAIGYSIKDSNGDLRNFRLYYFMVGSWLVEVEYQGKASNYQASFPMFVDFARRLSFTEP